MATPTALEYALMAGASYVSTRDEINRIPPPAGWLEPLNSRQLLPSGFEATQYTDGTDIVISYAGTGPEASDWIHGNIPLALGSLSDQLRQAADYYLQVKAAAPAGATISFTGHSLGGGLASLMAVFFGASAFTFDQAPFRNSALTFSSPDENGNPIPRSVAIDLRAYLEGRAAPTLLAPLDAFIAASNPSAMLAAREAVVTNINVQGEILSTTPLLAPFSRIGTPLPDITQQNNMLIAGVNLHSQALLTAFLQSRGTAAAGARLNEVTVPLRDLLGMIFDSALFARSTGVGNPDQPNFIDHIVRHEAGVDSAFAADAMVTRFTRDQWKLVQQGGLTMRDRTGSEVHDINKALIAFSMQKYYEETADSAGYSQELFTDLTAAGTGSNGIRFDMADVSANFANAFAQGEKLNLADAKGYQQYFRQYLASTDFTAAEQEHIRFVLPYMRDWYIQAGTGGMTATDTQNRGAFMLGGSGVDVLTGGTGADLLVGNAGNDTLQGGAGNDFLLGGADNDTYVYTSGFDTILDSDGSGSITVGGTALAGGAQYGDSRVHRDGTGNLYVNVGSDRLVIAGKVLIENWQAGRLGLNMSGPVADTVDPIQTNNNIDGDQDPEDHDDTIYDSSGNDLINAGDGNDEVWKSHGGDDVINLGAGDDELFTTINAAGRIIANGGSGRDYLGAGSGRDLIEGGEDADGLYGSAEADLIYGDTRGDTQAFISQGANQAGNGLQGEWVDAEDGDDKMFTGSGNDLIAGGAGDDLIVSGGGNDYIAGDWNTVSNESWRDWTVTRQVGDNGDGSVRYTYDITIIETESNAGTGNDVIYAGGGDDAAYGERGDDVIFGEAGADWLVGGEGNDVLLGGAGQDLLNGDGDFGNGNDYLDGGSENDVLRGNDGDDILVGGTGDDTLYGGAGSDIYIFNRGDGKDTVFDTKAGNNIFRFGAGISASDVTISLGSLLLDLGGGDAIHIGNFDQSDVFNSSPIGSFEFADGTTLTTTELLARGFDVVGTELDDTILGTNTTDRISGLGGDDFLEGSGGDDTLTGGTGADLLQGGDGDDALLGGEGTDNLFGNDGDDTLFGDAGADFLSGNDGNDALTGGAGADTLFGDDGDDTLIGEADADFLVGGDGNDTLIGGAGADTFDGGAGDDIFVAGLADVDVILEDAGGANTLQLAYSGDVSALSIFQVNDAEGKSYLVLADAAGGEVVIQGGFAGTVSQFDFDFGTAIVTRSELMRQAQVSSLNLTGTAGSQHFIGGGGADSIDGGAGADIMEGNAGDDAYVVDDADDAVVEYAAEGLDSVQSSVTYTLAANVENLTLTGAAAIDATGNASNNTLTGNAAANTLDGGAGNDTLAGGFGADTYVFGRDSGLNLIQETDDGTNAVDRVQFAADVAPADVTVSRPVGTGDLVLTISGAGSTLTVAGYFNSSNAVVEEFRFGDGTVWNDATIAQQLSAGTPGNDTINGTSGNDVLNGLAGNDILNGLGGDDRLFGELGLDNLNGGNGADILDGGAGPDNLFGGNGGDTYIFARGYENDFISETDDGTNPVDKVQFAADILSTDVTARRNGLFLELTVNGTADKVTIGNYFNNDATGPQLVEQLRFGDGVIWDVATVKALVLQSTTGNDTLTGYASNDVINGDAGADVIDGQGGNDTLNGGDGNDNLIGGNGDDILIGGTGNDTLNGGAGNDIYRYNVGDGSDTINNGDASTATTDTLLFGPGILPVNTVVTRNGTNFDLFVGSVKIAGYFNTLGGVSEIDEIRFTDDPGTVWTVASIRAMMLAGNEFANFISGFETDDTIDGLGGDDTIRGNGGNDTLIGGTGDDILYGNAGSDTLTGGAGNDQLNGEDSDSEVAGGDTLDGGAGNDYLRGRRGNDVYVFGRGYGHDTVDEASLSDGTDTLRLNAGVVPTDVSLFRHGDDLVVTFAGDQAQAWITQYFTLANKPIEQIVFNDGTVWDGAAIASHLTASAANAFTGTAGNDSFVVDHVGDTITEGVSQGTDSVLSSVTYTLPTNVENITLTGILDINAFGNGLNNIVTGNTGDNWLTGGDGNDTLNGGAGNDTLEGNAGDDVLNGGAGNDRLDGGAGTNTFAGGLGDDTYVLVLGSGDTVTEAAGEGIDTVIVGSSYTLGANLENLTVQSRSIFVSFYGGNALDNVITGDMTVVNDVYDGGLGADTIIARSGTFTVDNVGDQVITTTGSDTFVKSKVDWTLGGNQFSLELLSATAAANGTGNAANNMLVGNELANILRGLDGNDTLFGATAADTLIGGQGNDTYVLADFRTVLSNGQISYSLNSSASVNEDLIVEGANEGIDTIRSLFSYTLGDNVENLELMQQTSGAAVFPVTGIGNALANRITGNQTDNVIDGRGGADTMIGGQGDDTYYVDDAGDVVTENAGGGTADTVNSSVSYALGAQVENLTLMGTAGISGTGNELDNVLDGAQNGAGNVLTGGLGNDTYVVGAGDTIVEEADGGIDTVRSDVSFTVGANVENLVLVGSAATTGTGDALDNTLDGSQNAAANTLTGGQGNDTYIVDSGDVIVENAGEGVDTVSAAFDYALSANIENLTLTGEAISGTGSADNNVIIGNSSDNVIDGGGGADSMIGGFGNDTYHVDDAGDAVTELAGEGADTVISSVSYTLGAGLETLVLSGSDAISGIGNELDNTLDGSQNSAANVLSGGLGNDIYVLGAGDTIVENAGEGIDTVRSSVTATLGAGLENLELVGEAIGGFGNELDNTLLGNAAANFLSGGAGNDFLAGGLGDDTYAYALGTGNDVIFEDDGVLDTIEFGAGIAAANVSGARVGNDLVLSFTGSSNTLTLASFYSSSDNEIERVVFSDGTVWDVNALKGTVAIIGTSGANTLNGTSGDDRIFGLGGNDTLNGNAGNDFLDGGTGTDIMVGGTGDDTYVVDVASDITTESANAGIDTIQTNITLSLASTSPSRANIENLTLTGSGNINATGNTLANRLTGNSGNNTLDGGAGIDTMLGGLGNDLYIVDVAGDITTENANEGIDTIQTGITFSLATRDNIENLTLTGSSAINATGNALDNVLTGNTGANRLEGGAGNDTLNGGTGIDTMLGGAGNDLYMVDVSGDVTTENANEGIDTIQTGITFSLNSAARNNIENLTLTGTGAINATGNALNNILTGTSGNNTLTGLAGDDIYFLNGGTDTVLEAANEGEDLINSTVAITALANNVEHLVLTGTSAINGTGNTLNNLLRGNAGVNTLNGGTAGNDILEGGDGNDILTDTAGKNLLNGQAGADTLNGGSGNELLIGGAGNDTINTGAGADIIGFNRGGGVDTVAVSTVKDNSVSLGGGIRYADLFLSKSGNNLILKTNGTGATEQMTFTNWYSAAANRSVLNLQVVVEASADYNSGSGDALLNKKVARFNFDGLVNAFDAALVANPGLTNWALTNALLSAHLAGSDSDALGGDLAYRYGLQSNLAAVGSAGAQNVLAASQFGTATQAFQALPALESGVARLS